jgi:phosphopantetheinyl transferase (holo-ACP synthase)
VWVVINGVKPELRFAEQLNTVILERHYKAHLSLSHTLENAVATVVLEQLEPK